MERRPLGRTGVELPVLGLGTAPAGHRPQSEAVPFFARCLDAGVTHLDTGPQSGGYGNAQVYLGHVLAERRDEVFVATRCDEPDGEAALRQLRQNLADLRIEQADLVYVQGFGGERMAAERIFAPGGVCAALEVARRDGLTRFVGITGHHRPWRFLQAIEAWDFDVMMNPVSLVSRHIYDFEGKVWPVAARKGMGLVGMKVFGGVRDSARSAKGAHLPDDLKREGLRYALGVAGSSGIVVGMIDDEELQQTLAWASSWTPLTEAEMAALEAPTRSLAEQWGEIYGPPV